MKSVLNAHKLPPIYKAGGNVWESDPPCALERNNGFEDRGAHQHPFAPVREGFYP